MSLCWTNTSPWPDSQTAASFLKRSGGIVRSEWPRPRLRINCQISLRFAVVNFVKCPSISHVIREVKHHVCVKWHTQICTTWSSFLFTCRLLFIISTKKLVVSRDFLSIRIALSCFFPAHFLFWEIPNLNLTFAVCRLPSTWCLNSLLYSRIRQRKKWSEFCVSIGYPSGQDRPVEPAWDFPR